MVASNINTSSVLSDAIGAGLFSAPHFPFLPEGFPLAIAICAIKRPEGCQPPTGASHRTSAGTGSSNESAAFRAMCEAVERYALQYQDGRNGELQPIAVYGGRPTTRSIASLCLGHPDHVCDSKGCAAGDTLDDAVGRAAFEALENYVMPDIFEPPVDAVLVEPRTLPQLAPNLRFLDARLRSTSLRLIVSPLGFCVCHIVLSDPDGGRPTFGRAAGTDIGMAAEKALQEAELMLATNQD